MTATWTNLDCTTVGTSLKAMPLINVFTDRVTALGLDFGDNSGLLADFPKTTIGRNMMLEAFLELPMIPAVGDMHPVYDDCCCQSVDLRQAPGTKGPDSSNGILGDVTWIQARKNASGNRVKSVLIDPYQIQEIRNFDNGGARTRVYYQLKVGGSIIAAWPKSRIADIRVLRTMQAIRMVQYENTQDHAIGDYASTVGGLTIPFYNDSLWNGFEPNTLLFTGSRLIHEGIPIARREYMFLVNDRGWNKFFAVYTQQNGYVPQELDDLPPGSLSPDTEAGDIHQNGIGCFDMYEADDMADILVEISQDLM